MPSINLPYINIALGAFALTVVLIIFATCFSELITKKSGSKHFLFLLLFVMTALSADIVSWLGEGHPELSTVIMISNTVASCACQCAIICFMGYLKYSLYTNSKAAACTLRIFQVLCVFSIALIIGNVFWGYAYTVNDAGHYVHNHESDLRFVYLLLPILSFFAILLMALFAKKTTRVNRFIFIVYTIFPIAGFTIDHVFHGFSLSYIGLVISVLIIYTNIYLQKQKLIDAQRNALMLSQINPHFMYNTLSTIASMCDISPKQAKNLTIEFSQYLRRNLDTLTKEELIPFEQEMDHVACYLKIEKARFRERLNVIYSIQCKDFRIPPLTVQPLVENAVKHGITKKANGGTLRILTFEEEAYYIVRIIDDGVGFDSENTEMHVGLQNVRSRLAATCRGELTVKSTVGVGTRVTIVIPKKKGKRQ
ncbi:MAG: histidine kinase [Clostridia bacterium]|nr:histidine kinase [Clostridia bacterium]